MPASAEGAPAVAASNTTHRHRVAVCFTGGMRGLVDPSVYGSLKRYLVDPLEAYGADVDVFMWLEDQGGKAGSSTTASNYVCVDQVREGHFGKALSVLMPHHVALLGEGSCTGFERVRMRGFDNVWATVAL